jgi:hypothetical protein
MTPIGPLIHNDNHSLRMVAVHHAWALMYLKARRKRDAKIQFYAAGTRLIEARTHAFRAYRERVDHERI